MKSSSPVLTIAIPTWNRAAYLALTLSQLKNQFGDVHQDSVEILVSDNASDDDTRLVVASVENTGLPVHYYRNQVNIGSDANIAQCFNLAQGKYVLILGDDDLLVDGALSLLLSRLNQHDYGVVTLKPYGFDTDFHKEYPGGRERERSFESAPQFLAAIGSLMTLISACVVNKSLLPHVDASRFCGGNLVQVHLVLMCALAAKENLFLDRYLVACKRNNSGGYDFSAIFVTSFTAVLDSFRNAGLTQNAILAIEKTFLIGYYPYYLLRQRINQTGDLQATSQRFERRFKGRFLYDYWVAPIILLPRPIAIVWGAVVTFGGRVFGGELRRGVMFGVNKALRMFGHHG